MDHDFTGWHQIEFTSGRTKEVNIANLIYDTRGYVMFVVSTEKVYYNFNNVLSIKEWSGNG